MKLVSIENEIVNPASINKISEVFTGDGGAHFYIYVTGSANILCTSHSREGAFRKRARIVRRIEEALE